MDTYIHVHMLLWWLCEYKMLIHMYIRYMYIHTMYMEIHVYSTLAYVKVGRKGNPDKQYTQTHEHKVYMYTSTCERKNNYNALEHVHVSVMFLVMNRQ